MDRAQRRLEELLKELKSKPSEQPHPEWATSWDNDAPFSPWDSPDKK